MKKFLFSALMLAGCATVPPPTAQESCTAMCTTSGASVLKSTEDACVCKSETGIADNVGICLIEKGNGQQCLLEAMANCQDVLVKRKQGGVCDKVETALTGEPQT